MTALGYPVEPQTDINEYADAASVTGDCAPYVAFCLDCDIIFSDNDGNIRPQDIVTRGEGANALYICLSE